MAETFYQWKFVKDIEGLESFEHAFYALINLPLGKQTLGNTRSEHLINTVAIKISMGLIILAIILKLIFDKGAEFDDLIEVGTFRVSIKDTHTFWTFLTPSPLIYKCNTQLTTLLKNDKHFCFEISPFKYI